MGALGELLELLHDSHRRLSTLEVEYQDWRSVAPSYELLVDYSEHGRPQPRWRGSGPWPVTMASTRRIWLEPPEHARVEISRGEALVRLAVRNGAQWWRWDNEQGETTGSTFPDEQGRVELPAMLLMPMLDVSRLLSMVTFEPAGVAERAGREVVCAKARSRVPPPDGIPLVYELEFDAEHGSLLRRAEFAEDRCIWERVAVEVVYDAEIDSACFDFAAPDAAPS